MKRQAVNERDGARGKRVEALYKETLVSSVREDFERRRNERRPLEAQWRLNANFYLGNQYSSISPTGEVDEEERDYFWQEREVFNHIASIVETRSSKLKRVRPMLSVRPATTDEGDIHAAKAATKILNSAQYRADIDKALTRGTRWAEVTGTCFYAVNWDRTLGREVAEGVREGDVSVEVLSPYEIYPDSLINEDIGDCDSIIRARAVNVDEIALRYGVVVPPETAMTLNIDNTFVGGGLGLGGAMSAVRASECPSCAIVIERYSRPTKDKPNGELCVVCGKELLYYGDLPYKNGTDGARDFPFIKQASIEVNGSFFGSSMIERAIPIQRAYNAVKNRKHEYLNRLAVGVLAVEDGSVDMDNLIEEGLSPGKVIVYRQGSTPPRMLDLGSIPNDFSEEETRLLNEFTTVSGVSELMRSSNIASVTSGVALQLLAEQDDTRLSLTAEYVRFAARDIARQVLRLYKQFAVGARLTRFVGENNTVETVSWNSSDISSDDIIFDSENELSSSLAARQETMFELFRMGLLTDENGKLSTSVKQRFLDSLGFGTWDSDITMAQTQTRRADNENVTNKPDISEFDDHAIHIAEHTRYLISESLSAGQKRRLSDHIKEHMRYAQLTQKAGAKEELSEKTEQVQQ